MAKIKVVAQGRVIAYVVPEKDRRVAARKRLKETRKKARIVGDIMSPSDEVWNAQLGRY
jgi:hydrogenase maturation factor